jgi:large subunit ribosomal protein L3
MKVILGLKEKMTQIFDESGKVMPVTVVKTGPATITQIKNAEKDGYNAIQVAFGERKEKNIAKAQKGHFGEAGNFRYVKEFRVNEIPEELKVGDKVELSNFEEGDKVQITSFSKGKGFQGVVKRHGFAGGPRTHGQKHSEREPGSIGATGPQRVLKGTRMAGRMGNDKVTLKGVKIVGIDTETNEIYLKGAVPGRRGTLVEIQGQN